MYHELHLNNSRKPNSTDQELYRPHPISLPPSAWPGRLLGPSGSYRSYLRRSHCMGGTLSSIARGSTGPLKTARPETAPPIPPPTTLIGPNPNDPTHLSCYLFSPIHNTSLSTDDASARLRPRLRRRRSSGARSCGALHDRNVFEESATIQPCIGLKGKMDGLTQVHCIPREKSAARGRKSKGCSGSAFHPSLIMQYPLIQSKTGQ